MKLRKRHFRLTSVFFYSTHLLAQMAHAYTNTSETRPFASSVDGGPGRIGLGLMLGEPTGVTAKYWLNRTSAVDMGVAYSFNNYFTILSDYLVHFPNALNASVRGDFQGQFVPFIGIGGILFLNSTATNSNPHFFTDSNGNSAAFALRIPLGVEFLARTAPLGIYVELDPGVGIIPSTFGFLEAQIGARLYF